MYMFVGRCLATKVFIGGVWVILVWANDERGLWVNENLNWGAFNCASHAPQLSSCNYYQVCRSPVSSMMFLIAHDLVCLR